MDITNNGSSILIQSDDTQFSFNHYWKFIACNTPNTYNIINNYTGHALTDYNSNITFTLSGTFLGASAQWIIYGDPSGFCRIMDSSNSSAITQNAQGGLILTTFQTPRLQLFRFEEFIGSHFLFGAYKFDIMVFFRFMCS